MRFNPAARALRNSVLRGAAGSGAAQLMSRGVEAAGQVGAGAGEFLRVRRDPAEIARRRRQAAIRRRNLWGAGVVVGVAGGAALTVGALGSGFTASAVFALILVLAIIGWCTAGLARAVKDLRKRTRVVAGMPPPQPARQVVTGPVRAEIARLDKYSDRLRELVAVLPIDGGPAVADLRRDVVSAADQAERQLRRQAQEFTSVRRTARTGSVGDRTALGGSADELASRITTGVQEYGALVAAATDAVAAWTQLDHTLAELQGPNDRLTALAMGMREIAAQHR